MSAGKSTKTTRKGEICNENHTDNPFSKYSYSDWKTSRNCREVAACAVAAGRLGLRYSLVNAVSHAYYIDLYVKEKHREAAERAVIKEAMRVRDWEVEELFKELWTYVCMI